VGFNYENLILPGKKAVDAGLLGTGHRLSQSHAFGLVAGRSSAAHAQAIRRMREEKLSRQWCERWEDFCPTYLNLSRAEADRVVRLLDEFGPSRAIAPAVSDGELHRKRRSNSDPEQDSRMKANTDSAIRPNSFRPPRNRVRLRRNDFHKVEPRRTTQWQAGIGLRV
jgi:hypothetical protein